MKVFIIAAMSLDGFIARSENEKSFDWTSKEDKEFFVERTKKAGVVVFGAKTYQTIGKPLKDRLNIVYSRTKKFEGVETTHKEPKELIKDLESRGFAEVAICGGASIYTLFMKSGVVDEIYLTIEPIIFGQGIKFFNEKLDFKLELLESKILNSQGSLLLHYKVIKNY
jgi:dihydrofolate reductase